MAVLFEKDIVLQDDDREDDRKSVLIEQTDGEIELSRGLLSVVSGWCDVEERTFALKPSMLIICKGDHTKTIVRSFRSIC